MRRSRRIAAAGTRRASRRAVSSSTIAPRTWLRTASPRSATSSAASSTASAAARVSGGTASPNSVGNIATQVARQSTRHSSRLGRERASRRRPRPGDPRPGPPADRPGHRRRRRHGRPARRPGISRRLPERDERDLRERGEPVDARCGSTIRPVSAIAASTAATASARKGSPLRAVRTSNRACHASVRSSMYDHSSSTSSPDSARRVYASRARSRTSSIVSGVGSTADRVRRGSVVGGARDVRIGGPSLRVAIALRGVATGRRARLALPLGIGLALRAPKERLQSSACTFVPRSRVGVGRVSPQPAARTRSPASSNSATRSRIAR